MVKIDQIVVAKGGFSSQLFVRDRKHLLRHDDSDHIVMQWYAKGSCHAHNGGRDFIQSSEHIVMMDLGYESFSSYYFTFFGGNYYYYSPRIITGILGSY